MFKIYNCLEENIFLRQGGEYIHQYTTNVTIFPSIHGKYSIIEILTKKCGKYFHQYSGKIFRPEFSPHLVLENEFFKTPSEKMALGQLWSCDCPIYDSIGQKLFRSYIKKLWPKMAKCGEKKGHLQEPNFILLSWFKGTKNIHVLYVRLKALENTGGAWLGFWILILIWSLVFDTPMTQIWLTFLILKMQSK